MNIQKIIGPFTRSGFFTLSGLFVILVSFVWIEPALAQITPHEAIVQMRKGINLGNTHEPPTEAGWNNPKAQEYYFDLYKQAGFNFVRIPVRWDNYTGKSAPYKVSETWLNRIGEVLDWGLSRGLFIIVNSHHDEWIMQNYSSQVNRDRFDSIWSQIATRFKDKPDRLIFEIMNEPNGPITREQNDEMHRRVLSIIRKTNPARLVVFQGNNWGGSNELLQAAIPNDKYVIGSFHSYDPYNFGLQGQGTWGTSADYNMLRLKFISVKDWSVKNNIPVLLGEFGSLSSCEYNSRMKHYRAYVDFAREYGFAPAAWDDGGNFRIMNREERSWNELKDILIHCTQKSPGNPNLRLYKDSIIAVLWNNLTPGADSIVVERRTASSSYRKVATFYGDSTRFFDVKPFMNQHYHYRIISHFPGGEEAYSAPQRIFFPAWVKPVRTPFLGYALPIPGIVQAEDFDKGGQEFTFFDTGTSNIAGAYRPNEEVDIYDRNGTGFHIGNAMPGEWYEYTVDVKTAGKYQAGFQLASLMGGGKFQVKIGKVVSDTLRAPRTNSWLTTQKVTTTLLLEAGVQIMRFSVISDPLFNIDYYSLDLATSIDPIVEFPHDKALVYFIDRNKDIIISRNLDTPCVIRVVNMNGAVIRTIRADEKHIRLPSYGIKQGLYIVQMVSESTQSSYKVIVR